MENNIDFTQLKTQICCQMTSAWVAGVLYSMLSKKIAHEARDLDTVDGMAVSFLPTFTGLPALFVKLNTVPWAMVELDKDYASLMVTTPSGKRIHIAADDVDESETKIKEETVMFLLATSMGFSIGTTDVTGDDFTEMMISAHLNRAEIFEKELPLVRSAVEEATSYIKMQSATPASASIN